MSEQLGPHTPTDKKRLLSRVRRIEGQAGGLARMIEDDRPCAELLQQIVALTSAAEEVAVLLLQDHVMKRWSEGRASEATIARELGTLLRRILRS
jgi:DNA-binding FrmR family transcriptional regulator